MTWQEQFSYLCNGDLLAEFKKYDTKGQVAGRPVQSPEFQRLETQGTITKTVLAWATPRN